MSHCVTFLKEKLSQLAQSLECVQKIGFLQIPWAHLYGSSSARTRQFLLKPRGRCERVVQTDIFVNLSQKH